MGILEGILRTIVGFRSDGTPRSIELTDDDYVKVQVMGGDITVTAHALLDGTVNNDTVANAPTRGSVIYGNSTPAWDELVLAAANYILSSDGTDLKFQTASELGIEGFYSAYLHYNDEKSQNTQGGTFTQDAWRTRDLNQEKADTGGDGALASNQITLEAGTYRVFATAPAYTVKIHKLRVRDTTNSVTLALGSAHYSETTGVALHQAIVQGRFTLAAQAVIELQHYCTDTSNTNGFGIAMNIGTEIYAQIELWKEA